MVVLSKMIINELKVSDQLTTHHSKVKKYKPYDANDIVWEALEYYVKPYKLIAFYVFCKVAGKKVPFTSLHHYIVEWKVVEMQLQGNQ